jgi:hypothetical protein
LRGDDLGIDVLAQLGARQRDLLIELLGERLGLLVEHDEQQIARPALLQLGANLLVAQQIIVDVLDRAELVRPVLARHRDLGMRAVETVEIIDVLELVDPAAEP